VTGNACKVAGARPFAAISLEPTVRLPRIVSLLAAGCALNHKVPAPEPQEVEPLALGPELEPAPPASPRLDPPGDLADLSSTIDDHFEGFGTRRIHVQLDRPMFRPGETVWVKTWSLVTRGLQPDPQALVTYELLDPQGSVVATKQVLQQGGTATNDFELDPDAPGGQWTLRATTGAGDVDERPFVVASYATPRVRKHLEFVREAYGPGDEVEALVELEHGTGGALASRPVQAILQVGGEVVLKETLTTDDTGAVLVSARLPASLSTSDGLLTVLVEDGGITESISRSVPIVLAQVALAFYPEGGDLVAGLPGRVYFEAKNAHGEPADVAGAIVDDRGAEVARFESLHDGLGRVAFTPERGRTYRARVTAPAGVDELVPLPEARERGCTLRAYDDFASAESAVRVGVRCSARTEVAVVGVQRERTLDVGVVAAGPDADAVVYLAAADRSQGAVRVTVFDQARDPLAERLVYRGHGRDLRIEVTPDRQTYGPRDEVVLSVKTHAPSGEPVPAEVALSVVDDAVIGLADDEEGHMLTRLYLEPELVDSPKDPAFYFDPDEALAARAMDLVMGTRGFRRFEWQPVFDPAPVAEPVTTSLDAFAAVPEPEEEELHEPEDDDLEARRGLRVQLPEIALAKRAERPVEERKEERAAEDERMAAPLQDLPVAGPVAAGVARQEPRRQRGQRDRAAGKVLEANLGMLGYFGDLGYVDGDFERNNNAAFAPVRVFPKPDYSAGFTGVRSDFRDTVHWEPSVRTDASGAAEVRFYLSDAVTQLRVTAEGVGMGAAGHREVTLSSVLPVSIATRLPPAVSAGDRLQVPLTLTSTRDEALTVSVGGAFGSEVVRAGEARGQLTLAPGASDTFWIPVEVGEGNEAVSVRLYAEGAGLQDTVERELRVVPPGFPRSWSAAGETDGPQALTFQLDEVVPHSLTATATWHPSPVSNLISGMEGLIREPGGCFEQTSSTNWPNVAILNYLEAHEGDPRLKLASARALDVGYAKLTGYQVGAGGFETWGTGPGKEALSAFGLLQFHDMSRVYPVDAKVLKQDAVYLLGARDGKGGFTNSGESAHGYGSAPAAVLDGFITMALVQTGHGADIRDEIAKQAAVGRTTEDPYVLALAARSLHGTDHPDAEAVTARLAALQADDGSFPGAESSITRSYEANLLVESTALAALALMDGGKHRAPADEAAAWLVANRQGGGTWGATQATALALAALTRHAEVSRVPRTGGELVVEVNGEVVQRLSYEADQTQPLRIGGWEGLLRQGENAVVLRQPSGEPLPFEVEVAWTSIVPTTAPGAELGLETALDRAEVRLGENVRLTARVTNRTDRVVPSPIARIGLPAGLEAQTWQLKQLQERGEIAFFETRPREVTLYWDGVHASEAHEVALDLAAVVPGAFTGPASSAYPYYDDDEKAWGAGLKVAIGR
jgi:alpha-2-macroglobulin-like protein